MLYSISVLPNSSQLAPAVMDKLTDVISGLTILATGVTAVFAVAYKIKAQKKAQEEAFRKALELAHKEMTQQARAGTQATIWPENPSVSKLYSREPEAMAS